MKGSPPFSEMPGNDTENYLKYSRSEIVSYEKDELIFHQHDVPRKLLVSLEGAVAAGNDFSSGKRSIVAMLDQLGELFREVFLFLNKQEYDHYAQVVVPAQILQIPKDLLCNPCGEDCDYHTKLTSNMLSILTQKVYCLNRKLQIVSCTTPRQKIAEVPLQNSSPDGWVILSMNRGELVDFINTVRPLLSRELMKMQEDGIIKIEKRGVQIVNFDALQNN